MQLFQKGLFKSAGSTLLIGFVFSAQAATKQNTNHSNKVVDVEVVDKFGRSAVEYFYAPVIGINYDAITDISPSFIKNNEDFDDINVNKTEMGGVIGLLIDGQYQIVSTSYWRAGFQAGVLYTTPIDTEFEAAGPCNGVPDTTCEGTLETSSVLVPMLFTFSRYAAQDNYIVTFKFGPMYAHQMYNLDFQHYQVEPTAEDQILLQFGLDGRYRLGKTDNFILTGFMANFGLSFGGSNNSDFSGVQTGSDFAMFMGLSFS